MTFALRSLATRRLIAAGLTVLALTACGKEQPQGAGPGAGMPPPEVGVVALQPTSVPLTQDLVGRLAAYRSADVRARVPGRAAAPGLRGRQRRQAGPGVVPDRSGAAAGRASDRPQAALAQAEANAANAHASCGARAHARAAASSSRSPICDNALAAERSAAASVQAAQGRAARPRASTSVTPPCARRSAAVPASSR